MKNESSTVKGSKSSDTAALDQLTGGAFSAPTSGERASRIRDWLTTQPSADLMADVYKELSHRDKGAAKALKEKLDELRRQKAQESIAVEWAEKAKTLLNQSRLNVGDAMAWQRDAAKAGAPLSREPLSQLKQALSERLKAIEDLQTQVQIAREGAVLLAQRIEVLSTKPLQDSVAVREGLQADVDRWAQQAQSLTTEAQWNSIDLRFGTMLDTSKTQLKQVWEAFDAALTQAQTALADATAPLPAVPVWADEIRLGRGETTSDKAAVNEAETQARRNEAASVVKEAVAHLAKELEQGHSKAMQRLIGELRAALKEHGRWLATDIEAQAQALLTQAGDLEGWQRWRADQLREELIGKAEQLTQGAAEEPRMGGRKMQEALRTLREQWKQTDQGGIPNHVLWKRFDEACTQAHKVVEAWLEKVKAESAAHRAQRLALVQALKDWTAAHEGQTDWKAQVRDLSQFAEQWRNAGHLSEKQFAELQPLWKQAMTEARTPLDQAQTASLARREALIARAQELGAAPVLRLDAVRAVQQEWQQEAQTIPLDRRYEQKLWEAFRKPIDEAFERKIADREKQAAALNAHDQRVLAASKALEEAIASQDAQRIQAAMHSLELATRGQEEAVAAPAMPVSEDVKAEDTPAAASAAEENVEVKPASSPRRALVAVRGDDRPGQKKTEAPVPAKSGRFGDKRDGPRPGRDGDRGDRPHRDRDGRDGRDLREDRAPRGPRLGDTAFRAQRDAVEHAQIALKKLASQAHGQVLTHIIEAWKDRDANRLPAAAELGGKVNAATRVSWTKALGSDANQAQGATELLRLEMAAEVPTPATHLDARRALQLQLLTRRNDPTPAQTWGADVAKVLSGPWSEESAQRLQQALKPLIRR